MGQPIGDGSVKLSLFLGALVQEIVRVTLSNWWKLPMGAREVLWKSIQDKLKQVQLNDPVSSSVLKLKEDALSKLLGLENRGQNQTSEEGSTRPIVSPLSQNTNTHNNKCKLLDWMGLGEVVAKGRWSGSDPKELFHHIPLGPNAMRLWVDFAIEAETYLWWPTADMTCIEDTVGTIVAWPTDKVVMGQ